MEVWSYIVPLTTCRKLIDNHMWHNMINLPRKNFQFFEHKTLVAVKPVPDHPGNLERDGEENHLCQEGPRGPGEGCSQSNLFDKMPEFDKTFCHVVDSLQKRLSITLMRRRKILVTRKKDLNAETCDELTCDSPKCMKR